MNFFNNPNRIPENYGIRIALGLMLYFLSMKVIGLAHIVELRLLNLIILVAGIFWALKKFKQTHQDHLNYFRALITGVATGGVASFVFAFFLFLYLKLDGSMMQSIVDHEPMGRYLNPYMVSFIVLLEGVFSGLLVTFVLINYLDTDDVNDPQGESS